MSEYKKTYLGDYIKSYRDLSSWKREAEAKKKEYQTVSKKLDAQPYVKDERAAYDNSGNRPKSAADRVNADGSSNRSTTERGKVRRVWDDSNYNTPISKPEEKPQAKKQENNTDQEALLSQIAEDLRRRSTGQASSQSTARPTTSPQPATQQSPRPQPPRVEEVVIEDDGNYNFHNYPIEEIGYNQYKNLKTGKKLNLEEAKAVLVKAGYQPKSIGNVGTIIFIFIIANVVFPMAAPFVAFGYGVFKFMSSNLTWVKNVGGETFRYNMPASYEEKTMTNRIGQIAIVVGVIAAFIQYSKYFV